MNNRRNSLIDTKAKKSHRRKLRNASTAAEAVLWTYLKKRQLSGKKFRRQVSIGRYIVDFYCPECRLIVELDGAPHFAANVDEYDAKRTEYLEKQAGLKVIRFENDDVRDSIEFVLETIRENLH